MNTGDIILYAGLVVGIAAVILLSQKSPAFDVKIKWLIRIFSGLLTADFLLLTYYFYITNLTIDYVWAYTSKDLPLTYKLSGALAGQQGTLLFWAFLISIGSLWLNEKEDMALNFIKKAQILVLSLGIYFIGLTLLDSPFKTIYQVEPTLPSSFIPTDGSGLNPLLIDPWMAVHPPLIFLGYAAMTVPFAVAIMYLFRSMKKESGIHKLWLKNAMQWCRISWLFLTLGIAVGGFWSYKVLGWGGFWAWDPVETSSLIPWILLTGTLHALTEHRKDKRKYNILAPSLIGISFVLVIYATLVTRSGFFESVHAFGSGEVGRYVVILIVISTIVTLILASIKYLKVEEEGDEKDAPLLNMTNVFYVVILIFIVLTFISFWGITFPAMVKLASGNKYGVGIAFYNIWSYPFFILLMLLAGLGLNYKAGEKDRLVKEFAFFAGLTAIAAFIKPSQDWNIVDYSAIVSPTKPFLYNLIGSISALSFIPPSLYILYSLYERGKGRIKLKKRDYKIKEFGVILIHASVVFIVIGAAFSSMFTSEFSVSVDRNVEMAFAGDSPYWVKLVDYKSYRDYGKISSTIHSMGLTQFYDELHSNPFREEFEVHGLVDEVIDVDHNTYLKLVEDGNLLWVAIPKSDITKGIDVEVRGSLLHDFSSKSMNRTFDIILLSNDVRPLQKIISATQEVYVEVYKGSSKIGEGTAKSVEYPQSNVQRVLIDRGIFKDIYVIFTGASGDQIPLTIKIIPLVNYLWFGIILFTIGMIAILFFDPRYKIWI